MATMQPAVSMEVEQQQNGHQHRPEALHPRLSIVPRTCAKASFEAADRKQRLADRGLRTPTGSRYARQLARRTLYNAIVIACTI